MTMPWWIWLLPLLAVLLALYRLVHRPPTYHRHVGLDALESHVRYLIESRIRGAVLVLEREGGTGVFELLRAPERSATLRVPDITWATEGIADAEQSLRAAGFGPTWNSSSRCGQVRRSLHVATDGVNSAVRAVQITAAALGWQPDTRFTVHLERGATT
jgi:hypothetical protein